MEIICPNCQYTREVPEEKLPAKAVMATCPKCKQKFKFREAPPQDDFLIEEPAASAQEQPEDESVSSGQDTASEPGTSESDPSEPGPSEDMDSGELHQDMAGEIPPGPESPDLPEPSEFADSPDPSTERTDPPEPTAQDVWQKLESMPPPEEMAAAAEDDPEHAESEDTVPEHAEAEPVTEEPAPYGQEPADEQPVHPLQQAFDQEEREGAPYSANYAEDAEGADDRDYDEMPPDGDITVEVPWERTDKYGFFPGLSMTVKRAMFAAPLFFRTMPLTRSITRPLGFAVLLNIFALLCEYAYDYMGLPSLWLDTSFSTPEQMTSLEFVMLLSILPAGIVFGVFLNTVFMHLFLMLVGAAKSGFEGTFRAVCYGSAPMLLNMLPYVGPLSAMVWSLVVTFIALKHVHRTSFVRLGLALALPVIFVMGALLLSGAIQPTDLMNR